MDMFMLHGSKQPPWRIYLRDRRNPKLFNENDGERRIMTKRTHFAATKRVIIDYGEFSELEADEAFAAHKTDFMHGVRSSTRQRKSRPRGRDSSKVAPATPSPIGRGAKG